MVFWGWRRFEKRTKRLRKEKEKIAVSFLLVLIASSSESLLSLSLFFSLLLFTLMGLVTLTRAPTSTPSWISLPGPKARTVREAERTRGAPAERRRADDDGDDDRATHRLEAAEAVVCMVYSRAER